MDIKKVLFELSGLPGPSGAEDMVSRKAAELLGAYMDSVYIDKLNNVIGLRRCGKKNAPKLVLDAHLDEIGLIITGVENGFLRFIPVGGIDLRMLAAKEIKILSDEPLYGVVTCLPPHLQSSEDMNKAFKQDELFIDIGMTAEQAEKCVPVGTRAVFSSEAIKLYGDCVSGKAFDDRAGFTAILRACELLSEKKLEADLYILGSTQEEVGCRGAKTGIFAIDPDYCIAVDVTHGKTPDAPKEKTFELGGGPAIGVGPNMDKVMTKSLVALAEKSEIKYQLEVMEGNTGTNAWPIQVSREGIKTALLSIPLKYMHSPSETLDMTDLENTAQLLSKFVLSFGEEAGDYA